MILHGKLVPHWYYRSNEWIDQPYFNPSVFLQPYIGPPEKALSILYGRNTFRVDEEATYLALQIAEGIIQY